VSAAAVDEHKHSTKPVLELSRQCAKSSYAVLLIRHHTCANAVRSDHDVT